MSSNANNKELQAGTSLTQDAWRRLKRSRPAMASLWILIAVFLGAFLTPIFPLQPPDQDQTKKAFEPPTLGGMFEETFRFDPEAIAPLLEQLPEANAKLKEERQAYLVLTKEKPEGDSQLEKHEKLVEAQERRVSQARAAVEMLVQRPYADAGYPKLDPLARTMVRIRHGLFGNKSLVSICGRDKLGRDILSRIFWGARVSLIVGIVATLVSLTIGVTYGAVSGYFGGWIDNLMMRIVDVLYSVPFIFLVIFIITVLNEHTETLAAYGVDRITIFYLVVGAIYWLTMARVVRGQVISLRNEQFVEAAQSIGVSQASIIFRHIVPNLFSVVIVYLTLTIPRVVLFEAFLSFLGMGVEPPDVSWGLLANEGIKVITPVKVYWWLILFPSMAIGITLFALNFLGDGLRDAFDPRMKDR